MTKPFYTSGVDQDLTDIINYIGADNPTAALAWIDKIEAKCLLVATNPSIGELQPHLGEGVGASVVGRYVIFHREANDRVEILRVIPGDRNITRL
jgi:toxin ParE1/3/4